MVPPGAAISAVDVTPCPLRPRRAPFGRAGNDTRDRRPCRNATTGFRGVDSVPPNELREPAGCCAMRRARATLRLTPGLRGNAQDELFLRPTGGIAFTAH